MVLLPFPAQSCITIQIIMELKILRTKEEEPTLKEAQEFVGGLVELVRLEETAIVTGKRQ